MKRLKRSVTLVELLIAIALLSLIGLAFASIDIFSRYHVISADRRVKMQNELSSALEEMQKTVSMGVGDYNNPPISLLGTGFQVRVDATPNDLTDDSWNLVTYTLSGNMLSSSETGTLSSRIVSGISFVDTLPENPPLDTTTGFYIQMPDNNTVEVGLVARWNPDASGSLDNPQISLKSKMATRSASVK